MSSTAYMMWFLAMAVLVPVIVHGGTTWAYFQGKQQRAPAIGAADANHTVQDDARQASQGAATSPLSTSATGDDGRVSDKQIWRWHDDGGAVTR